MKFIKPLKSGRLIRRYKRFLAAVNMAGKTITAHCPNTGSMLGCQMPGARVWLGVRVIAVGCEVNDQEIRVNRELPVMLNA